MKKQLQSEIIIKSKYLLSFASTGSSCLDIKADLKTKKILKPFTHILIPTGLFIEKMKENYEAQIRSRSGLALKNNIIVLNSPGTIDSDYRGEIKVILYNLSKKNFIIKPQNRIAQICFNKIQKKILIKQNNTLFIPTILKKEKRQKDGFGSSKI